MKSFAAHMAIVVATTGLCLSLPGKAAQSAGVSAELITLGTIGGPPPTADRAQFSNLLIVNGTQYLVDAGDGVMRRLAQAKRNYTDIGQVFLTHLHGDHTGGLANMLVVAWQFNRREPIEIYGPPGTNEVVDGALAFNRVDEAIRLSETRETPLASIVESHVVNVGQIYEDENMIVTAAENTHFQFKEGSPAYEKYNSFGYRFEVKEGPVIVFTGDTGPSDAVTELARGADVLISECIAIDEIQERMERAGRWDRMTEGEREGWLRHMRLEHMTPEEAGRLASEAGVGMLILSHLSNAGIPNDDYQRFVTRAATHFDGRIVAADDLMKFEF